MRAEERPTEHQVIEEILQTTIAELVHTSGASPMAIGQYAIATGLKLWCNVYGTQGALLFLTETFRQLIHNSLRQDGPEWQQMKRALS